MRRRTARRGCRGLVRGLAVPEDDVEAETDRLHALVDGLAVHAAMRPDLTTPARMRMIIAAHLAELERTAPDGGR